MARASVVTRTGGEVLKEACGKGSDTVTKNYKYIVYNLCCHHQNYVCIATDQQSGLDVRSVLLNVYRDRKDRMVLCGVHRPITYMNMKASRMGFEPRSY